MLALPPRDVLAGRGYAVQSMSRSTDRCHELRHQRLMELESVDELDGCVRLVLVAQRVAACYSVVVPK